MDYKQHSFRPLSDGGDFPGARFGRLAPSSAMLSAVAAQKDVDEKLLWYNALAFLSKGKLAISYALAQQVRTVRDSEIAINAVKLMDHLRAAGVPATSPMLKNPWNTTPLNLGAHLALLVAIPGAIGLAVYLDNTKSASIPSSVRPSYQASLPTRASPASGAAAWPPPPVSANAVSSIPTCAFPPRNGEILLRHGIGARKDTPLK